MDSQESIEQIPSVFRPFAKWLLDRIDKPFLLSKLGGGRFIPVDVLRNLPAHDITAHTATGGSAGDVPTVQGDGSLALQAPAASDVAKETEATGVYLKACFYESDPNKLFLLISGDGEDWKIVKAGGVYNPAALRDPSIVFHSNKWWVAYTNDSGGAVHQFSVASSDDLLTWAFVANVDMTGIAGAYSVWAPEFFVDDDGLHVLVAVSTGGVWTNFQIYETHPTNATLTAWSAPVKLNVTGKANIIDPFLVKRGGTYYLWYKQQTDPTYIEYASSATLTGTYTVVQSGDWAGWGSGIEGQSLVQVDADTWRLYFDDYIGIGTPGNGIFWSESSDDWATWSAPVITTTPGSVHYSHPTILLCQGAAELSALRAYLQSTGDHGLLGGLGDDDHPQYQLRSERAAASGYASLDGTTRVPTPQLGSGSASASTYLRGDRTWATTSMSGEILTDDNYDVLVDDAGNVLWGDE